MEKLAYSPKEAMVALSVSRATLWRLAKIGDLNPRKIGHRTVFLADELQAFVKRLPESNAA